MSNNLNITFSMGALPEGFRGTPQEFADLIAERLQVLASGDFIGLSGQIGGSKPTRNLGVYFDTLARKTYFWDETLSGYYPTAPDVPVGTMLIWPSAVAPSDNNYLVCSGQTLLKTQYPNLYAVIGDLYRLPTDDVEGLYFRLPKPQGRTPMGAGQGIYTDTDGSGRTDKTQNIILGKYAGYDFVHYVTSVPSEQFHVPDRSQTQPLFTYGAYNTETSPPSFGVNFIIKAK